MPVLKSFWLLVHVTVITASYGFLGLCSLLGGAGILVAALRPTIAQDTFRRITAVNEMLLTIGLYLLIIGNFLGAM